MQFILLLHPFIFQFPTFFLELTLNYYYYLSEICFLFFFNHYLNLFFIPIKFDCFYYH